MLYEMKRKAADGSTWVGRTEGPQPFLSERINAGESEVKAGERGVVDALGGEWPPSDCHVARRREETVARASHRCPPLPQPTSPRVPRHTAWIWPRCG